MKKVHKIRVLIALALALLLLAACSREPTGGAGETEPTVADPGTQDAGDPEETEPTEEPEPEPEETPADLGIRHVVIIGVDGGGAFFKEADTPNLDRIMENGAVTYDCLTSKPTISAQCWGSMLHGVTPEIHGLTNSIVSSRHYDEESQFPSVFRVIRENMPDAQLASFCDWDPINYGIIEENLGVVKDTGGDAALTGKICAYLEENEPTLLFVQFDEVDGAGHGSGYGNPRHLNQLHTTDGYIEEIYETLERRGMLDSTLFIVTADHGGTPEPSGGSHGGWTDAEKYILFAAAGPGIEAGEIEDMEVRDTASIVLYALGLASQQPESWTSRVPTGVFEGVEAGERKEFTIEKRTHENIPTPTGEASVTARIGEDRVLAYFAFDGDTEPGVIKYETAQTGKIYFVEGYCGEAAQFDDGYVSIQKYKPGTGSFSVAFWMKTSGVDSDPAIFSNKNWDSGANNGFVLSLRSDGDIKFNAGDGANRLDDSYALPLDYCDGWVYVILIVDREAGEVRFSYDFGTFLTDPIPAALVNASFNGLGSSNIGQDGTGRYSAHLSAALDEFLLVDGVLTDDDIAALKDTYGVK